MPPDNRKTPDELMNSTVSSIAGFCGISSICAPGGENATRFILL